MTGRDWTVFASDSYLVQANAVGVEVTNLHTGETQWLQGEDGLGIQGVVEGISEIISDYAKLTEVTDHFLSQYFGRE